MLVSYSFLWAFKNFGLKKDNVDGNQHTVYLKVPGSLQVIASIIQYYSFYSGQRDTRSISKVLKFSQNPMWTSSDSRFLPIIFFLYYYFWFWFSRSRAIFRNTYLWAGRERSKASKFFCIHEYWWNKWKY